MLSLNGFRYIIYREGRPAFNKLHKDRLLSKYTIYYIRNMSSNATTKLNKIYDELTYFDHYGSSVIGFIAVTSLTGLAISYYYMKRNSQDIKDDWVNQRCNPNVIPFAGYINAPDGTSASKYTSDNLNYCVKEIIHDASEAALSPINLLLEQVADFFTDIMNSIDGVRGMIARIRKSIADIFAKLMGKIMNFVTPLQIMLLTFKDIMGKAQGIMAATLYFILGVYNTIQSAMGAGIEATVKILIIMVGVIAALSILPFTMPAAAVSTVIFLAISIPLAIITSIVSKALHIKSSSVPGLCFDKNTQIKMKTPNNTYKPIREIVLGDVLDSGSVVTGVMQLAKRAEDDMYNLKGITVSGSHLVKNDGIKNDGIKLENVRLGSEYIKVQDHIDAVRLENYTEPVLYCLNTSDKRICIGDMVFTDWDELYDISLELMKHATGYRLERTDGGFVEHTKIEIKWGNKTPGTGTTSSKGETAIKISIKDVALGDVLKNGEVVLGTVKVGKYDTNMVVDYCLGGHNRFTGANIKIPKTNYDSELSPRPPSTWVTASTPLYHLITDKGVFTINEVVVRDYNSLIDVFFEDK